MKQKEEQTETQENYITGKFSSQLKSAKMLLAEESITESLSHYEQSVLQLFSELPKEQALVKFKQIISDLLKQQIKYLNLKKFDVSWKILLFCDQQSNPEKYDSIPELRSLLYNNIGCYFKRINKQQEALQSFQKALEIIKSSGQIENLGLTYLNLSALQSEMGDHENAKNSAHQAVIQFENKIIQFKRNEPNISKLKADQNFIELIQLQALAYNNIGNEEEFFHNLQNSEQNFQQSLNLLESNLGQNHSMTKKLQLKFQTFTMRKHLKSSHEKKNSAITVYQNEIFRNSNERIVLTTPKIYNRPQSANIKKKKQKIFHKSFANEKQFKL